MKKLSLLSLGLNRIMTRTGWTAGPWLHGVIQDRPQVSSLGCHVHSHLTLSLPFKLNVLDLLDLSSLASLILTYLGLTDTDTVTATASMSQFTLFILFNICTVCRSVCVVVAEPQPGPL